jgi:DNA-binding transcriptional regulator YdaS (Cro superfamily)
MMERNLFNKIVDSATNGNQSELARQVGISPQLLTIWRNTRIPAHYVTDVCKLTNGEVEPHDVRPDVFLSEWRV